MAQDVRQRVADLLTAQPDLMLSARPAIPGELDVTLAGMPGPPLHRRLGFRSADCRSLPQAVALLVRGWLGRRWRYPSTVPEPVTADAPPPPSPPREPVLPAPVVPIRVAADRAPALRLSLIGGGSALAGASAGGLAAQAEAEWIRTPHASLALLAGVEGPFNVSIYPGRVETWALGFAALGRLTPDWPGLRPGALDLSAGLGLDLLSASSKGFPSNRSERLLVPAVRAGARYRRSIGGPFSMLAGLDLSLGTRVPAFQVRGMEGEFVLAPLRVRFLAGVAWDVD